ncbi:M14 metallopeptidase family protein [Segetibacter sp. 3557_3]|uniref:M14 family metallopeptidase n=1 Tax=Segetibacter sp. 3557_3 TaxID=2547429 RepID=UPI001A9E10AD|nr:M14 metallopeptidase family protein [Segetibacter sp. 3557_3]
MLKIVFTILFAAVFLQTAAQTIPTPKDHFGFSIGDDYQLANYTQTEAYFKKLAAVSDRVKLVSIGQTEEGRPQYMVVVSSPANIKALDRYKQISQTLARAEELTDEQARELAANGKAVVWIDGGLHATEVVATQQLIENVYQFVSRTDAETLHILDEAIILFVHANPDGMELVSDWYMREKDPKKRKMNIPRLYQKYIGHDNNRDFFMLNMKESENISRQQYIEWMPQIVYNHHQAGPAGSIVAGPPYRDPFNYVFDPLLVTTIDALGAAMNSRLNLEGKPGYTQKAGSVYSTWWNGGLRTAAYFHNITGLLTEIIGNPTPASVPLVPARLIPNAATPFPVMPQQWRFRQSIDYSVSLNYAVLNYAVNQRKELLFGIYRMGKNSIDKGNRDTWSLSPKYVDSINNAFAKDQKIARPEGSEAENSERRVVPIKYFDLVYKDPSLRDPRGYILPANQPDFPTAVRFVNALIKSGIRVHRATADFSVAGKDYPVGSYVVTTAQAFRPHVLDMFEPQDHPNDFQYPGGPPVAPYDAAGYTLAYEMGIKFDRVMDAFTGPFEKVPYGELQASKPVVPAAAPHGYILSGSTNNAFIIVNELLYAGVKVYRVNGRGTEPEQNGAFYIPATNEVKPLLLKHNAIAGIKIEAASARPAGLVAVSPLRVALWDSYGGSIASGWVRWLMEQYHFKTQVVYPTELNRGKLNNKFDLVIFVSGAIPATGRPAGRNLQPGPEEIPSEFHKRLGRITADTTVPQLRQFVQDGGRIITIGSSANLAYHFNLPVRNALVEVVNGVERPLPKEKFYIPGSIMSVVTDPALPSAWGMPASADVYFDESPVFAIAPQALAKGDIKPIAWFASAKTLRSGWAWGQGYLQHGIAAFEAKVGKGTLYVFGPEITFRGQTHGTFKLLFNQLYRLSAN